MIENFFRHRCDIYHVTATTKTAGYGLPNSEKTLTKPALPSLANVKCFFAYPDTDGIMEKEPATVFTGANEISLPAGTVINYGDVIIDKRFNVDYTAGFPEDVRGKYIAVPLTRRTVQEAL
ncbi:MULTISPECIES: DUF3599 family protein [unclassified Dehalobacter]|uniref:DUF3599 family protein n=1 Tax=unclassified Dehalobacter TaxID=2635733 RepID=UPI00104A16B7|nr:MULTISPECIES: DUF3599 family protein [unclassified Dehalobacter]TCX51931.1 hypothetical protein C1I36_06335 [Dehalobacter sp. 14DCB1]TCX52991.1 hypothetical protein C1I38_08015 [Dehalobacter sp. 12DCB1]